MAPNWLMRDDREQVALQHKVDDILPGNLMRATNGD